MYKIITYLFIGVSWDIIMNFISFLIQSKNKFNNFERLFNIVAWPWTFTVFMYHFLKTYLRGK